MGEQAEGKGIAWTETTWNPIRGCSRVSQGCVNCYAETMAARFSGKGQPYEGLAKRTPSGPRWTNVVRMIQEHLDDPIRWQRPRKIFVNSMSDVFHENLSNEEIAAIFGIMAAAPHHIFQVLTKRAKRMLEWFQWAKAQPEGPAAACAMAANAASFMGPTDRRPFEILDVFDRARSAAWPLTHVHLGVSVENEAAAQERLDYLLKTPARVRWVSYEPALGPVDFAPWLDARGVEPTLDWIVIGGESGPGARPMHPIWAESVIRACQRSGVAVFFKQTGAWRPKGWPGVEAVGSGRPWGVMDIRGKFWPGTTAWNGRTMEAPDFEVYMVEVGGAGKKPDEWPESFRVREYPG